jgi:hypothetical protein
MDTKNIERYAPQARRDFIQAATDRAAAIGIRVDKGDVVLSDITVQGDVAFVEGRAFPVTLARRRKGIEDRINQDGFDRTMEAVAYTWFNRLIALRYMEIHGYLDHGYRVLSHPSGEATPEILQHAEHVDLPGLDRQKVIELKLDGTQDEELYRKLLVAQCNDLHRGMPFLFELVNDASELLLPDNLLHTNSIIRSLVDEIPEGDWQQVEVVGWIYQFYIKERKDEVIGRVVKSEDIPAATQLFTPNWIVQYLVQNSLGRQWMATYPGSALREHMPYYIEPAEQTEEVQQQLEEITPDHLNPEELTVMDPACGSGHMLIEAYNLLVRIYQERGYRRRDIPRLILEKNLRGLDIDERAVQLAGFGLTMRAAADNRHLLRDGVGMNVVTIQSTGNMDATQTSLHLGLPIDDVRLLIEVFQDADTFGSLIQVPPRLSRKLDALDEVIQVAVERDDALADAAARCVVPIVKQTRLLAAEYDVVVTNPPYMGRGNQNPDLKRFAGKNYAETKVNLFSMFIERGFALARQDGYVAMVTMQSWMFLSSFEDMRRQFLSDRTLSTMAHLGMGAFSTISGAIVQTTAFSAIGTSVSGYRPTFYRLVEGSEDNKRERLLTRASQYTGPPQREFAKIPGSPIAYWVSDNVRSVFEEMTPLGKVTTPRQGTQTSDDGRFLRLWWEVDMQRIGFRLHDRGEALASKKKWYPLTKGGPFRKWYGNNEYVINWMDDGAELRAFDRAVIRNDSYCFRCAATWSNVSSSLLAARYTDAGFIFGDKGPAMFNTDTTQLLHAMAVCNSKVGARFLSIAAPTLDFHVGSVSKLPLCEQLPAAVRNVEELIRISRIDWGFQEISWDYREPPLRTDSGDLLLSQSFRNYELRCQAARSSAQSLEEDNNRLLAQAYGLSEELSPDVPDDQITLARPDREEDMKRLTSYAVGCAMGRYSLDEPGLMYAESGDEDFDASRYGKFPATDDGILLVTPNEWFEDDGANRFEEFLKVAWPGDTLEENLRFVADSLNPKKSDTSRQTIRRYFAQSFFKDHLQTYKRRPIYWLFSSGKKRAFQALVYLHRYNESTLARMRTAYVIPLAQRMRAHAEQLDAERKSGESSTTRTRQIEKDLNTLEDQQAELRVFDEQLQHYAEQQMSLDLDDGVKVNYGKFGSLLSDVKAVTGKAATA